MNHISLVQLSTSDVIRVALLVADSLTLDDIALVGGKNASLGELAGSLSTDIRVAEGFAVTATAYRDLLESNALWPGMEQILTETNWSTAASRAS